MTNGNEPAYPHAGSYQEANDFLAFAFYWPGNGLTNWPGNGLTKREYFASAAMAAFANDENRWLADPEVYKSVAECAVNWADALIEALNK